MSKKGDDNFDTDYSEFEEESTVGSSKKEDDKVDNEFEFTNEFDEQNLEDKTDKPDDFDFDFNEPEVIQASKKEESEDSNAFDAEEFSFDEPDLNDAEIPLLTDKVDDDFSFEEPNINEIPETNDLEFFEELETPPELGTPELSDFESEDFLSSSENDEFLFEDAPITDNTDSPSFDDSEDFSFDEPISINQEPVKKEELSEFEEFGNDDKFTFEDDSKTKKEAVTTNDTIDELADDDWLDEHISASKTSKDDEFSNTNITASKEEKEDDFFFDESPSQNLDNAELNEFEEIGEDFTQSLESDFFEEPPKNTKAVEEKLDEDQYMVNNSFNKDNVDKDYKPMAHNKDEFEFEDDSKDDNFDNDFSFDEEPEVEPDFNFSADDENTNHKENKKRETEEEEELEPISSYSDEDAPEKGKSNVIKYSLIALAVALMGGGALYLKLAPTTYEDEEIDSVAQEEVAPVKKETRVPKKEQVKAPQAKTDIANELDSLGDLANKDATKPQRTVEPTRNSDPVMPTSSSGASVQQLKDMQNQLNSVMGNVSKLSRDLETANNDNKRLERLVEQTKQNSNTAGMEAFQLDFSNLRSDVNIMKQQLNTEKESTKDTMIKFLTISKRLKEEIESLKNSQLDKKVVEDKLKEIDNLTKQLEVLNNKVSNTEVISKINNIEKAMNEKKLSEVEKQVTKTQKEVKASSNTGKKSVLELLEAKNKKASENVVEEEEPLTVPLSVVIEEDATSDQPVVKKQTVKQKPSYKYYFVGTIEGIVYLKNSAGTIVDYREHDQLPGYGEILKIYNDGSIETEQGNVKFSS